MFSTATDSLLIDTVPWDRGAGAGRVAAGYIQTVGLRPEDCVGIVPAHRGAGELLFLYRDSPEYAERRGRPLPATGHASRWFPGVHIEGPDVMRAADDDAAPVFCHHLQWPGVSRVEGFGSPGEYFSFYSRMVGLRPEDCFGWVPDRWNPHDPDVNHWEEFHLVYRDRPEYREGRARLAGRGGRHEVGESDGFGGSPDGVPPLAGPSVRAAATTAKWPRRRLMRVRGDEFQAHLRELAEALPVPPERCFGIGVDRWSDHTWTVTAR